MWQIITQSAHALAFDVVPQVGNGVKKLWNGYNGLVGKGVKLVKNRFKSTYNNRITDMQIPTNQD